MHRRTAPWPSSACRCSALAAPRRPPPPTFPSKDSGYHNYAEMVAEINKAKADHPDIVDVFSIGKSYQGRKIWAAKISDNVADDENEPEVLFDGVHHAREHLSLEQTLAILRWLTDGYGSERARSPRSSTAARSGSSSRSTRTAPSTTSPARPYRAWRKNRQPNAGTTAVGTDLNRNYGYRWGCCGGSSGSKSSRHYRGPKAFSAPETRAMRDFMDQPPDRWRQQIKLAITFHSAGKQILWPYGYTHTDVPSDMTAEDHAALVAMGKKMASLNGYTPMQSSSLYVTDGDEIDWAYGSQRIWMYTFELYPSHAQVSSDQRFYPPDEIIGPETQRNKEAILQLIEPAGCRYRSSARRPELRAAFDDFEISAPWKANPLGTDTATGGAWQRGNPAATTRQSGIDHLRIAGAHHRSLGRGELEHVRRRRGHLDPRTAGPARRNGRQPDLPLLPRPRLEFVVSGLLPCVRRARGRQPDARAPGGRRGERRQAGLDVVDSVSMRHGPGRRSGSCSRRPTWPGPARSKPPWTTSG